MEISAMLTATGNMMRSVPALNGTAWRAPRPAHAGSTESPPAKTAALPCGRFDA